MRRAARRSARRAGPTRPGRGGAQISRIVAGLAGARPPVTIDIREANGGGDRRRLLGSGDEVLVLHLRGSSTDAEAASSRTRAASPASSSAVSGRVRVPASTTRRRSGAGRRSRAAPRRAASTSSGSTSTRRARLAEHVQQRLAWTRAGESEGMPPGGRSVSAIANPTPKKRW